MGKTYVLSDVHIGTNGVTCWYNRDYHEPYLKAVLKDILDHKPAEIDEVILLGDLFDFWTYAPDEELPSIDDILKANPRIFLDHEDPKQQGKLIQVVNQLPGKVKYLRGNHDINITQADLDKIAGKNKIQLVPDMYIKDGVLYMHGHHYTIFNAPDVTVEAQNIAVGQNADEVFYVAKDGKNSIYHFGQVSNGEWVDPAVFDAGGEAHNLAVGSNADGRKALFHVGTTPKNPKENESNIYYSWQAANNAWSGHIPFGGQAKSLSLALGQNQDGRLELFYIGNPKDTNDNQIYHCWQEHTNKDKGWSKHLSFGKEAQAKNLGVGRDTNGCLHLFYVRMTEGRVEPENPKNTEMTNLYHCWQVTQNKNDWTVQHKPFGGKAQSLAVGQNQNGRLEIFYVATDGKNSIYHCWQTDKKKGWSAHEKFSGEAKSIGVGRDAKGRLHLFYVGNDDHVYHVWQKTAPGEDWSKKDDWSEHVRISSIPVGHFVTRILMQKIKDDYDREVKEGKKGKMAFELKGQGSPNREDLVHNANGKDINYAAFAKLMLDPLFSSDSIPTDLLNIVPLPGALLDATANWAKMPPSTSIELFNHQKKSLDQVKSNYANLISLWRAQEGVDLMVVKSILADVDGSYIHEFAQKAAQEKGAQLVVLGHTHSPNVSLVGATPKYINSGYMCPAKPDVDAKLPTGKFTFTVITRGNGGRPQPELYEVVHDGKYKVFPALPPGPR